MFTEAGLLSTAPESVPFRLWREEENVGLVQSQSQIQSTPGFPVLHSLPELVRTHVRRVSDAVQPTHLLSPPSPLAFNLPSVRLIF